MSDTPPPGDVYNPFCFDANIVQLEWMILTGIVVAGKIARIQQEKLKRMLTCMHQQLRQQYDITAFSHLDGMRRLGFPRVLELMKQEKIGQYTRCGGAFKGLMERNLNLRICRREELVTIPGIGLKTASFFILFTRRDVEMACLDTHILAYMKEQKLHPKIPRATPSPRLYLELEAVYLAHCRKLKVNPAAFDFKIWLARNRGDKIKIS